MAQAGFRDRPRRRAIGRQVTPGRIARQIGMRKTLSMVGSVAVSSILGWAGAKVGIMTGFMLGTIGGGLGMYAGYRLAAYLDA